MTLIFKNLQCVLLLVCIFQISFTVNGQTTDSLQLEKSEAFNFKQHDTTTYAYWEAYVKPKFTGCDDPVLESACFQDNINNHVFKNFYYPEEAKDYNMQGLVTAFLKVDTTGIFTVIRTEGKYPPLNEAAAKILSDLPIIAPAEDGYGNKINTYYRYHITFRLNRKR